jgi:hypothetical protein
MSDVFAWLDKNVHTPKGKLLNQLLPVSICLIFYVFFVWSSKFFIAEWINPQLAEKVLLQFRWKDVLVGFFLYFVTAIDYALVVGRMQVSNPGSKARVIMNIFTVLGCYVGVSLVLFLWGFAKEVFWLIIPILIFAGSVMIKLAHEGLEYFENSRQIPSLLSKITAMIVDLFHYISRVFTFWIPEIAKPSTNAMSMSSLAKWSFVLPFIIGLDDLIGYMGAMTIYNVFGLLVGIYFADILIDILVFVSPTLTKKVVESAVLSFIATYAFLYLAYKSYSESMMMLHEHYHVSSGRIEIFILSFHTIVVLLDLMMAKLQNRHSYITTLARKHRS